MPARSNTGESCTITPMLSIRAAHTEPGHMPWPSTLKPAKNQLEAGSLLGTGQRNSDNAVPFRCPVKGSASVPYCKNCGMPSIKLSSALRMASAIVGFEGKAR